MSSPPLDAGTVAPWAWGGVAAALALLDLNLDELITQVKHTADAPREDLKALSQRIVRWVLTPNLSRWASDPDGPRFDVVDQTLIFNLSKVEEARGCLVTFEEAVIDLRRAVKLAAISVLPAAAYASALALGALSDGIGTYVFAGSAIVFSLFAGTGTHAYLVLRHSRTRYDSLKGDLESSLSVLQTTLGAGASSPTPPPAPQSTAPVPAPVAPSPSPPGGAK